MFGLVKVFFEDKKYYCGSSCALRISVDREVSVFVTYTVANQQALLQRQAESAAVVQRLFTGVTIRAKRSETMAELKVLGQQVRRWQVKP